MDSQQAKEYEKREEGLPAGKAAGSFLRKELVSRLILFCRNAVQRESILGVKKAKLLAVKQDRTHDKWNVAEQKEMLRRLGRKG